MPIDEPDLASAPVRTTSTGLDSARFNSARFESTRFGSTRPGAPWQNLREHVASWFRPTHPRFTLHLFLIALALGLLLGLASLAMTGIVQLSRRGPVATGSQATGPGSLLPAPMADGKAALSAAGAAHPSSLTIEDDSQAAPVPQTATDTMAVDPSVAGISINASDSAGPTAMAADDAAQQDAAPDQMPLAPAAAEPAGIEAQAEVMLSVQVDAQGNPLQISVQRSSGSPALDNAALLEVRNRHFPPTLRDGEPVPATLSVPVRVPMQDQ